MWNDDERALDSIQYVNDFVKEYQPDITVPVMCKQIGRALSAIPWELCYISVSAYPPTPSHIEPKPTPYYPIEESSVFGHPSATDRIDHTEEEFNSELLEVAKFSTT
jgi:hypothetical protein